jgi:5-methylcytosine-specific restriction protein A
MGAGEADMKTPAPKRADFEKALYTRLMQATANGQPEVLIRAGDLHMEVGCYPNAGSHRMPVCCSVMRQMISAHDEIVKKPPRGDGASLVIRYRLPRKLI